MNLSAILTRLESVELPAVVITAIVVAVLVGLAVGLGARYLVRNAPATTLQEREHAALNQRASTAPVGGRR